MNKNEDIEILRAIAILFTMLLHLKIVVLYPAAPFDWVIKNFDLSVGVDLFLVISGFVIARSIRHSQSFYQSTRRRLIFSFWIKRVFRLLPAAWLWVIIVFLYQLVIGLSVGVDYEIWKILIPVAAALGNVMNFYAAHCTMNPGDMLFCGIEYIHGHYWSLSLEEQFYLIFPVLFLFVSKRFLVPILIAAIVSQLMWTRPFLTTWWVLKTDALCWGVLLAVMSETKFYQDCYAKFLRLKFISFLIGLFFVLFLPAVAIHIQGFGGYMKPYGVSVVALLSAVIVWLASYGNGIFKWGKLYSKVMLYIGGRSYSLYLSHLIIFFIVKKCYELWVEGTSNQYEEFSVNVFMVCVSLLLAFFMSELTYRFVEVVYRRKGRRIAERIVSK